MARRKFVKNYFKAIIVFIIPAILMIAGFCFIYPDVSKLKKENPLKTSFMEYREKEWRQQGRKMGIKQTWTPLSRISPYLIKAVLIAEDDKFYQHEGFDFEAIQTAIEKDIKQKKIKFGGSTISQQLSKNLYLSPSKNPLRKLAEAVLTWRIERTLSKKRILELYLNVAEWGEGIFGIGAASFHYYGKLPSDLNPEEASRLASVLPNPRKYDPARTSGYVERRSKLIYNIMVRRGIVTEEYD
ncbi:MAG: monofunctional biosynthetic peptidoglycan transglycosylase [Nitrospiraceae bacterium]|nr:MAG: monofunctional biosynthetic peptidoglycan transglycosylase [Nitrospiraceae bacterium]